MKHLDLCSGIGGFALAALWVWPRHEVAAFVEIDDYCQQVLRKHWPNAPIHSDLKTFDARPFRGSIDLLTGGYPCQPFSHAGKRKGEADDRHLWPEVLRVTLECRPRWALFENVAGHVTLGLDQVLADLERGGTPAKRRLFRLVPSMPRTDVTGFGLLPTMTAQDANGRSYHYQRGDKTKQVPSLLGTARLWPTPKSSPSGPDFARANREGSGGDDLATAVARALLPTPTAQDSKNATLPPSQEERDSIPGRLRRDGHSGALNPEFVEYLMGFPAGWTDLEPSETR